MKKFIKASLIISIGLSIIISSYMSLFASSPINYSDSEEILNTGVYLTLPQNLNIIYPTTSTTTTSNTFYIAGTSNPSQPLYINDQEFTNRTSNGMFEVQISVPQDGAFQCILRQGDTIIKVPIFKNVAPSLPFSVPVIENLPALSTVSLDSQIYPFENVILNNAKITLSCTAPSNSSVTAEFCGNTYNLTQEQAAKEGVHAKFSTILDFSNILENNKTYALGNVVYNINYNGTITQHSSIGKIYYSQFLPPFIKINWALAFLLKEPDPNSDCISILKKGIVDRVIKEENGMYLLGCGAWIGKKYLEPIFDNVNLQNTISAVNFQKDNRYEKLVISGTSNPIFTAGMTDNNLTVRLYNTFGNLDLSSLSSQSDLFNNINSKSEPHFLELTFDFKSPNILWGYNVEFTDKNETIIYAKKKPRLSEDPNRPLSGISIALDAGHGGSDSGTLGAFSHFGFSSEKDVNLVNTLATKTRLEKLGATVYMTRYDDRFVSLNNRAEMFETWKPDFIVVLHANAAENTNAHGVLGFHSEANPFSSSLSKNFADLVSSYTGRANKGPKNYNFYISRCTFCPCVYGEIGFLTNFSDTASIFSDQGIFGLANSIGDLIIKYLSEHISY